MAIPSLCAVSAGAAPAPGPNWVPRDRVVDILALEDRLQRAVQAGDTAVLDDLLDAGFVSVTVKDAPSLLLRERWVAEGVEAKWSFTLNHVTSGCLQDSAEPDGCRLVAIAGVVERLPRPEAESKRPYLVDLWASRGGTWRLVRRDLVLHD